MALPAVPVVFPGGNRCPRLFRTPCLGPESFAGKPLTPSLKTLTFDVADPGPAYVLDILKFGFPKAVRAVIHLNGVQILSEADFDSQLPLLEKQVTLLGSNSLSVEIRSGPKTSLILFFGKPRIKPSLACVDSLAPDRIRAVFGYQSLHLVPIRIPSGPGNRFLPGPVDRGKNPAANPLSRSQWRHRTPRLSCPERP